MAEKKKLSLVKGFIIFLGSSALFISCSYFDGLFDNDKNYSVASEFLENRDTTALDFFIISDWGFNASNNQLKVRDEMDLLDEVVGLEFIISCGDNFHDTGVSSVADPLWQSNYFEVYNIKLPVPWYSALGNHDYIGDPDAQVEYTDISEYWNMPARYYSFNKDFDPDNSARFIILDTQGLIQEYKLLQDTAKYYLIEQYSWLKELLNGVEEKWVIVIGHNPVFSASPWHDDDAKLMKKLIRPLLNTYDVDFYISGHDHDFEHARENGRLTDYIVTGTGALPTPVGSESTTLFSLSALGFTYMSMSANTAELFFITADDRIAYNYVKTK